MEKIKMTLFLVLYLVLNCYGGIRLLPSYNSKSYEMPKKCEGLNFCTDNGDYPTGVVDEALGKLLKIQQRIGEEIDDYQSRVGDFPPDPECATNEIKFKPIYYILDQNHTTRVVVQSEKYRFSQKYDIRWCKKVGRVYRTLNFSEVTLSKVNMTCNNVKATLDFQVLTSDKLHIELISAEMPVFCRARYDLLP